MTTSQYIIERTGGVLSLIDDSPSSSTVLDTNHYFALMFCTEYQSYLRNYIQYKGFSNYNEDLDLYDIDLNKNGFDSGYYVSKDYYNLKKVFKQVREDRGRIIVVSIVDSTKVIIIEPPEETLLEVPVATVATSITTSGFTTNWLPANNALGYYLDVYKISSYPTFNDYYLPSINDIIAMYNELFLYSVGGFNPVGHYWSSSEYNANQSFLIYFGNGITTHATKNSVFEVRSCRSFNSSISYSLRDIGPGGGLIFYKDGNDYKEAASTDQSINLSWEDAINLSRSSSIYTNELVLEPLYNNLNVGNVLTYPVIGLVNNTTYYYRLRAYNNNEISDNSNIINLTTTSIPITDIDGNIYTYVTIGTQQWMVENLKTTHYADGTPIPNISNYDDWFLPSKDEVSVMYTELKAYGIGGFYGLSTDRYASSSEKDAFTVWGISFFNGADWDYAKNGAIRERACRAFTSITSYSLRDIGPAGGWIFWKSGNNYLEAAPHDQSTGVAWSNITNVAIGTTSTAIGTGQANTTAIIGQAGHTDSVAKLCDDLTSDLLWSQDTEGAYCWHSNDISNKTPYGALYNYYAVDNIHGLAPTGWRIPSDADFDTLITYLGGSLTAGGKLKEIGLDHWLTPNTGATDEYGFKAVGGGFKSNNGVYNTLKTHCSFWTSDIWSATMKSNGEYVSMADLSDEEYYKNYGDSIRCVRDIP